MPKQLERLRGRKGGSRSRGTSGRRSRVESMSAPALSRKASPPVPRGGLVASSRSRARRGGPRVVVACSRDGYDDVDAHRKRTTTTLGFSTRRGASLASVSAFFAAAPSRASESLALSDAALVDRVRAALDALETLPQVETVPLWFLVLAASEMVPLLPTQPMALTSGIVFGAVEGTAVVLAANVAAATLAFFAARGAGRALAEKIVEEETGAGDAEDNAFRRQWRDLQKRLENAGPAEQTALVALFRITPHPFSASNYLFGLTKIQATPYVAGTAAGIAPWAALYAFVGAYGRALLDGGEAVDEVFADLGALVESDVEIGEEALAAVGGAALLVFVAWRLFKKKDESAEIKSADE